MTRHSAHVGTRAGGGEMVRKLRTLSIERGASVHYADPAWRLRAACTGQDTERWFTDNHSLQDKQTTLEAQATCLDCPVRSDCLKFAVANRIGYGVFGGMTADERRKLKKAAS